MGVPKPNPKMMSLYDYQGAREAMGVERRRRAKLSYGIHSADAFIARYHKYEREWLAAREEA